MTQAEDRQRATADPSQPSLARFAGKAALVTGGGSGLGRAVAVRLAAEGASVAVTGRRPEPLAETIAEIESRGGHAVAIPGDVTLEGDAELFVQETVAAFGGLDILVNNAGAISRGRLVHETSPEVWQELVGVNLVGVYLVTRAALQLMVTTQGDRCILNIGSALAHSPSPGISAYVAAKGGVVAFTRSLAVEYGPKGIRANCVCPGLVPTRITYVDRPNFDELREGFEALYPLGRLGTPEEVAAAVAYLASSDAVWVTGVVLDVDGGFSVP
jgi:NAD(P)-dependent dehydrogenase (short-subunit alcohol dehydrogenase family)